MLVPLRQALTSYGQMRQSAWSNFVDRAGLVGPCRSSSKAFYEV